MGIELFHADGETDKTKLTVAIRNFANAPKSGDISFFREFRSKVHKLHDVTWQILAVVEENINSEQQMTLNT